MDAWFCFMGQNIALPTQLEVFRDDADCCCALQYELLLSRLPSLYVGLSHLHIATLINCYTIRNVARTHCTVRLRAPLCAVCSKVCSASAAIEWPLHALPRGLCA
jgi:hypothetical protein